MVRYELEERARVPSKVGNIFSTDNFLDAQLRIMTTADIPDGMRLKEIAGWNQTPTDWERFLQAGPDGCFVALVDQAGVDAKVCGTATTIIYEGKFAWIGMVLVDPDFRGRGIGTDLLKKTIGYLDAKKIPSQKLDATPAGKPLYEKLGFVVEYELERWVLNREPAAEGSAPENEPVNLSDIFKWDREVFGADRSSLLGSLNATDPDFTLTASAEGALAGYALGRRGSRADHLGPWVARDETAARELLAEFLRRSRRETIFADCFTNNSFARRLLEERKFQSTRTLTRMYRGTNQDPGRPELICAALGPEFG